MNALFARHLSDTMEIRRPDRRPEPTETKKTNEAIHVP